jgi:hypothetical protein
MQGFDAQSFEPMISQRSPEKPMLHPVHSNPSAVSVQIDPFKQGDVAHASWPIISQVEPENPNGHAQENELNPSVHTPLLRHATALSFDTALEEASEAPVQ